MTLLLELLSRPAALAYGAVAAVLLVVIVVVPEAGVFDVPDLNPFSGETTEAMVLRVEEIDRTETEAGVLVQERIEVELDGGEVVAVERRTVAGDGLTLEVEAGDRVLVTASESPSGTSYFIADRVRTYPLWTLALAFAGLVVVIGWWRGLWSLVGLAASFLVIVRFVVPAILSGWEPLVATLLGAATIMLTTLVLAHGANWKTAAALAGTALSLVLAVALAAASVSFAELSGFAEEQAVTLQILSEGSIDARGLLLGGIIIGALGVLDDVTATQASTVFELREANPALRTGELFARGLNVGRDHIASTVNTLVLAYAGAALPLVVILAAQPEPLGILVSRDLIATEVVRTLTGSIGIVAAVPITTAIAAVVAASVSRGEVSTDTGGAPAELPGWSRGE